MTNEELNFSQMLLTKFCHDIAGKAGAIANGIEIIQSEHDFMKKDAVVLINNTSQELVNILIFLRFAYGMSDSEKKTDPSNIIKITQSYFQHSKFQLNWRIANITNNLLQIICNILLIIKENITTEASIDIITTDTAINLNVYSSNLLYQDTEDILIKNYNKTMSLDNIQIYLVKFLLEKYSIILDINTDTDMITFCISEF